MQTAWIFETGLLWKCPYCKKLITSSKEKLPTFHQYCGACGKKMFTKSKEKEGELNEP